MASDNYDIGTKYALHLFKYAIVNGSKLVNAKILILRLKIFS